MTKAKRQELKERLDAKTGERWYGLAAPEGWYNLIDKCDKELEKVVPGYIVQQIKEKFGGLRYYIQPPEEVSDEAYKKAEKIIEKYEKVAEKTCETCGKKKGVKMQFLEEKFAWPRRLCTSCGHKWAEQRGSKLKLESDDQTLKSV